MSLFSFLSPVLAVGVTAALGVALPNVVLRCIWAFIVFGYLVPQLTAAFSSPQDLKKKARVGRCCGWGYAAIGGHWLRGGP